MKKIHALLLGTMLVFTVVSCAQSQKESTKSENSPTVKPQLHTVGAAEFNQLILTGGDKQIVDVRTPDEFASGHINGAVNYNVNDPQFAANLSNLDKTKPVYIYCLSGGRSAGASQKMLSMGFTEIYDMKGGMMAWRSQNLPVANGGTASADKYTKADYQKLITSNKLVLIDYYAPWCAPCKKMEPTLTKLAEEFKGKIVIERINVDEAKTMAQEMKLEAIPVITTVKNGVELAHRTGFQTEEQFRELIAELLK
jgi:thioredoxin 1